MYLHLLFYHVLSLSTRQTGFFSGLSQILETANTHRQCRWFWDSLRFYEQIAIADFVPFGAVPGTDCSI